MRDRKFCQLVQNSVEKFWTTATNAAEIALFSILNTSYLQPRISCIHYWTVRFTDSILGDVILMEQEVESILNNLDTSKQQSQMKYHRNPLKKQLHQ